MKSLVGKLLVATPQLIDPNFFRTVVLVMQHDEEGCVGLVINRETDAFLMDHLPEWDILGDDMTIMFGGPVDPAVAIGLRHDDEGEPIGMEGLSLVDLSSAPGAIGTVEIRVYSGYAGWGAGQLEAELTTGSWYVIEAKADDPFTEAATMWSRVLRRQTGLLSLVASFPEDVSHN